MAKKLRVLINASMFSDEPTGVGVHIREIINQLPGDSLNMEFECCSYSNALNTEMKVNQVRLPVGLDRLFGRFRALHRFLWNLFVLPVIARKYDVVYSGSSHGTPFFSNQIITVHDLICLKYPAQHKLQYYYFRYVVPLILRSCKKVIAVSEFTKREVIKTYGLNDRVVVVHNGGDHLKTIETGRSPNDEPGEVLDDSLPYFLAVGCSYPHKNIEGLIEAFDLVKSDFRLIIVGASTPYGKYLKRKYSGNERVTFLDFVDNDKLSYLYTNAAANVYVSLYEGFGFPPYEAALNGTVSIVSNAASLPEIYGNSVYYVDPGSREEITRALDSFAQGEVDLAVYRKEFPRLLRQYKWSETAKEIVKTISEI